MAVHRAAKDDIIVLGRRIRRAVKSTQTVACRLGNSLEWGSDKAGGASVVTGGIGFSLLGGGILSGNPLFIEGGGDVLAVSGVLGSIDGAAQAVGGILQGISGHGFGNLWKAGFTFGLSATFAKVARASTPRGTPWGRLRAQQNSKRAGNVFGFAQQLVSSLGLTQVTCG